MVEVVIALPDGVREGDVVAGKYRILRVLGSGAMGIVASARHLNLDRTVAIKFLVAEALNHPDAVARFVREARAAARIQSAHVVRVHDVAVLESGMPYIELEYLEGSDLAARLRQRTRLPIPLAVDFVLQACDAIAEAHELGIIHRDLKPANLFAVSGYDDVETIKVLDFGISKSAASVTSTMSPADWRPGAISTARVAIGSPCYMSPEQMESARDVDRRTDIWALGVTLCELVTGRLPFQGQSLVELYATIKSRQPLHLRSRCPELPEGLEAVLLKCIEFDREQRFPHVCALAKALVPFGTNPSAPYVQRIVAGASRPRGSGTSDVEPPSEAAPLFTETRLSAGPRMSVAVSPAPARRPPVVLFAVGLVAAVSVAAVGTRWRDPRKSPSEPGKESRKSPSEPAPVSVPAPVGESSAAVGRAVSPSGPAEQSSVPTRWGLRREPPALAIAEAAQPSLEPRGGGLQVASDARAPQPSRSTVPPVPGRSTAMASPPRAFETGVATATAGGSAVSASQRPGDPRATPAPAPSAPPIETFLKDRK